jgi:hypothetical protein
MTGGTTMLALLAEAKPTTWQDVVILAIFGVIGLGILWILSRD